MAIQDVFGVICPDTAPGIALRMDHGTQYLSETTSTRFASGASPRPSPSSRSRKTNGVAKCCNRALKEQAIHRHVFKHPEGRCAVRSLGEGYKDHWRVEKLGLKGPRPDTAGVTPGGRMGEGIDTPLDHRASSDTHSCPGNQVRFRCRRQREFSPPWGNCSCPLGRHVQDFRKSGGEGV